MSKVAKVLILFFTICMLNLTIMADSSPTEPAIANDIAGPTVSVLKDIASMPLCFTENRGQWDDNILFRADAGGATMWFAKDKAYYQFSRPVDNAGRDDRFHQGHPKPVEKVEHLMINASFVGANPNPQMVGLDKLTHTCNYFFGNDPAEWRTNVPSYQAIVYEEIYPGIDLKYFGGNGRMEYDFIVSPGADPSVIRVHYDGANDICVNDAGELVIETDWGTVTEMRPYIYQIVSGERVEIKGHYSLTDDFTFGFNLDENYNPELALVIDPSLAYSTYLGGTGSDYCYLSGVSITDAGDILVAGYTNSTNFPTLNYYDNTANGSYDIYVVKLRPSVGGSGSLIYSTYIGGSGSDYGYSIASDDLGNAYLTGYTNSTNLPVLSVEPYPYNAALSGNYDAFLIKLFNEGDSIMYGTYLGGSENDYGFAICVDTGANPNAYITGRTSSSNFPKQNEFSSSLNGGNDAFITKIAPYISGSNSLIYSTFLGGSSDEYAYDIDVDIAGNVCVTGRTSSNDFPTTDAFDSTKNALDDAFLFKLSAAGDSMIFGTYYGGSNTDYGYSVDIGVDNKICITGYTNSVNLPTFNPYSASLGGSSDAFVAKFSADGKALLYATYLGGSSSDVGYGVAFDDNGNIYVCGVTNSTNFPVTTVATHSGLSDAFVAKIVPALSGTSSLAYSTFLGGTSYDEGWGLASNGKGNIAISGHTYSTNFNVVNEYDATSNGLYDVFVSNLIFLSGKNNRPPVDTVTFAEQNFEVNFSAPPGDAELFSSIRYLKGGQKDFVVVPSYQTIGNTAYFAIPESLLTVRGVDYYFYLLKNTEQEYIGGPNNPLLLTTSFTNAQGMRPTAMPNAQYRIVGLPIEVTGSNDVASVFADDMGGGYRTNWRLGRYESDSNLVYEYPNIDSVKPGVGYWLVARGGRRYGAAGYSVHPNRWYNGKRYYEVPLDSGWNQLANPFAFKIDWDSVMFDTGGVVVVGHDATLMEDSAYYYNGTEYSTVKSIPAWEGVFFKTAVPGMKALFYYREGSVPPKLATERQPVVALDNWSINLKLTSGGKTDAGNFAGVRKDALSGRDDYDFSEPPPAPESPWLAFRLPDQTRDIKRSDFRPPFEFGAEWEIVLSKHADRVMMAEGLSQIPEGMSAWMILDNGDKIPLFEKGVMNLPNGVESARLLIGTEDFLSGKGAPLVPYVYTLEQNFPNPFNPTTSIRFALPTAGQVRLEVFNMLGQRVVTLLDREVPAGYHSVDWSGRDSFGNPVASGIYLYKIKSGSFTDSKKMILLK